MSLTQLLYLSFSIFRLLLLSSSSTITVSWKYIHTSLSQLQTRVTVIAYGVLHTDAQAEIECVIAVTKKKALQ